MITKAKNKAEKKKSKAKPKFKLPTEHEKMMRRRYGITGGKNA